MDFIGEISRLYDGSILPSEPYTGERADIPEELLDILRVADGIRETMPNPETGEPMSIAWVLYPYDYMVKESEFYHNEYGVEGTVFADDGAGNPYILKSNGSVSLFDAIDVAESPIAVSLMDFYTALPG
ncbi:MAG: SMI1/KNR4 family protein [Oscillospiraceae bacterium]|nr:SMI1/KNR4 family protein [Oscillospiraceae bacterium]